MRKEPAKNGNEHDWTTKWRHMLCVFSNNTGLGKRVKRAMNKRARKRAKLETSKEAEIKTDETQ